MKRKMGMMFVILLIVTTILSSVQLVSGQMIELYYDDGGSETSIESLKAKEIAAVRFTPPVAGIITNCRFYARNIDYSPYNWDDEIAAVHVMNENREDIITPVGELISYDAWYDVDLRRYEIIVNSDFYIGIESTSYYPRLRLYADTTNPDGRSWYFANGVWSQETGADYLIRLTIERIETYGTIFILPDGSISPLAAPITRNENYYTLTSNLYNSSIVVQRNDIIFDGAGRSLKGPNTSGSFGISLYGQTNITIRNVTIKGFDYGIYLVGATGNTVYANNLTENTWGIGLMNNADNNLINKNTATRNTRDGILIYYSSSNRLISNDVSTNDRYGIELAYSNFTDINRNNMTANYMSGVAGLLSFNNTVSRNTVTGNNDGVRFYNSSYNKIITNNLTTNARYGLYFRDSSDNIAYNNNFVDNLDSQAVSNRSVNIWNDGYPSGGNYWSDYLPIQLYYDDGNPETSFVFGEVRGIAAVRFTSIARNMITNCGFFVYDTTWDPSNWDDVPVTIKVHVMNENREDIITPILMTLTYDGWYDVNLTEYRVSINANSDFYLGVEYYGYKPRLYADTNRPDNRSWYFANGGWTQWTEGDYIIRATFGGGKDADGDGIGDTPYLIDENNQDRYPLMRPQVIIFVSDLNMDSRIDIKDITMVAVAYGSRPSDKKWNSLADLDGNQAINILDIARVAMDFGLTY